MANLSQVKDGWLRRRSEALSDIAQFGTWSLGRMAAPRRRLASAGLIAAAAASPWVIGRFGWIGWIWVCALVVAVLLFFVLLIISYLRARLRERASEAAAKISALAVEQGLRDQRIRDSVHGQLGEMERRLTGVITAQIDDTRAQGIKQIRSAMALSADKVDVLRAEIDGEVREGLNSLRSDLAAADAAQRARIDDFGRALAGGEQALHELRFDTQRRIDALDRASSQRIDQVRGDLGRHLTDQMATLAEEPRALAAAMETRLAAESVVRENGLSALRSDIGVLAADLGRQLADQMATLAEEPRALAAAVETRLAAESVVREDALSALRSDIGVLMDARSRQTDEVFSYLRGLLERRVQAGAAAIRADIEALRDHLNDRLRALESAEAPGPDRNLIEEIVAEQNRVHDIDGLRRDLTEALHHQEAAVRAFHERHDEAAQTVGALRADLLAIGERLEGEVYVAANLRDELKDLRERQEAGTQRVEDLRSAIAEALDREEAERTLAISAVAEESLARHQSLAAVVDGAVPTLESRISDLQALLEARMGPEFEARLEDWRARLDNEIGAALQQGRTEDGLANQEREARLRSELQSLYDAILRQREEAQALEENMWRSMEAVRADLAGKLDMEVADGLAAQTREAVEDLRELTARELAERDGRVAEQVDMITSDLARARLEASREAEALEERISARTSRVAKAEIEAIKAEMSEQRADLIASAAQVAAARLSADLERALDGMPSTADMARAISTAEESLKVAEAAANQASDRVASAEGSMGPEFARLEREMKQVEARSAANDQTMRRLSDSNAAIARPFDRMLTLETVQRIESHWLKAFGINMTRTALAYMAHKICLLEDRGMGRIAAPIETIVMRQLALRSLANRGKLEVMEIGTLFGLSAAVLYNHRGARASGMALTLIDPLEGYYEAGGMDPVTGIEVSESVLRQNLADLDVPEDDYRLIKALSADPRAIRQASDRLYDMILIDGDHSTAGVAADFENYGPLVKPGGLIVFDDYGSEHWPGIQPYVDETVRADPNWIWIGAEYRTAILAKKADGATAKGSSVAGATVGSRRAAKR